MKYKVFIQINSDRSNASNQFDNTEMVPQLKRLGYRHGELVDDDLNVLTLHGSTGLWGARIEAESAEQAKEQVFSAFQEIVSKSPQSDQLGFRLFVTAFGEVEGIVKDAAWGFRGYGAFTKYPRLPH